MKNKLRKVEKKIKDSWKTCLMKDLKIGDVFRMFEGDEKVGDEKVGFIWEVTSEPRIITNEFFKDTWGVKVKDHKEKNK